MKLLEIQPVKCIFLNRQTLTVVIKPPGFYWMKSSLSVAVVLSRGGNDAMGPGLNDKQGS